MKDPGLLLPIRGQASVLCCFPSPVTTEMQVVPLSEADGKPHLTLGLNSELEYEHRYLPLPAATSCMVLTAAEGRQRLETTVCV